MHGSFFDGHPAEERREVASLVPAIGLVSVVWAEDLAGLPECDVLDPVGLRAGMRNAVRV
jgi:hypothetical protein